MQGHAAGLPGLLRLRDVRGDRAAGAPVPRASSCQPSGRPGTPSWSRCRRSRAPRWPRCTACARRPRRAAGGVPEGAGRGARCWTRAPAATSRCWRPPPSLCALPRRARRRCAGRLHTNRSDVSTQGRSLTPPTCSCSGHPRAAVSLCLHTGAPRLEFEEAMVWSGLAAVR